MKNIKKYSYIRENSLVKDIFIVSSVSDLYKYLDFNFAPIGNMSKTICGYNLFNINIIKSNIKDIYFEDNIIKVGSGLMLSALDNIALKNNICNFNFLRTIPGSVGGALIMNASFLGETISNSLLEIEGFDYMNRYIKLKKEDIIFFYRYSNIKEILKIVTYAYFKSNYADKREIEERIITAYNYRKKQPNIKYTLGSAFKNKKDMKAYELIQNVDKYEYKTFKVNKIHKNFLEFVPNSKGYEIRNDLLSFKNNVETSSGESLEFEIQSLYDIYK